MSRLALPELVLSSDVAVVHGVVCCAVLQAKQGITKAALVPQGLPTHLAASLCSGFVAALISTPADVIKTRLMAQAAAAGQPAVGTHTQPGPQRSHSSRDSGAAASGSHSSSKAPGQSVFRSRHSSSSAAPHYRGMLDCAVRTVQQEGLLALYKG